MSTRITSAVALLCGALLMGGAAVAEPGTVAHKLLFVAVQGSGTQILSVNADGSEQKVLTAGPGENYQPAWSPDGSKIAFTSTRDGVANSAIYVMDADGSNQRRMTNEATPDNSPAWSPDGSKIVFRSYRDRRSAFYVMNADGSNLKRLSDAVTDKGTPRFSPDGRYIAYEVYGGLGSVELRVMKSDGSEERDISTKVSKFKKTQPVWSPDGSKLAFVSVKSYGENNIWVVNADGSNPVNLTDVQFLSTQPAWSPDGKRIAFVSNRYGDSISRSAGDIYVMNADGSGAVNLTRDPGNDEHPVWSADGRSVYFLSMRNGPPQLFALELEGGPARRVTQHAGQDLTFSVAPSSLTKPDKTSIAGVSTSNGGSTGH